MAASWRITTSKRAGLRASKSITTNCNPTLPAPASVGRARVMSLLDGKMVAVNLNMVADLVICDPVCAVLPLRLTAATGIDAMSHGVETCCSIRVNLLAAAIGWMRYAVLQMASSCCG